MRPSVETAEVKVYPIELSSGDRWKVLLNVGNQWVRGNISIPGTFDTKEEAKDAAMEEIERLRVQRRRRKDQDNRAEKFTVKI